VQTFLSDLEAPDLVHPVVYSPYGSVDEDRSGGGAVEPMQSLLTVPPVIGHCE
jgi:hypothetical protein